VFETYSLDEETAVVILAHLSLSWPLTLKGGSYENDLVQRRKRRKLVEVALGLAGRPLSDAWGLNAEEWLTSKGCRAPSKAVRLPSLTKLTWRRAGHLAKDLREVTVARKPKLDGDLAYSLGRLFEHDLRLRHSLLRYKSIRAHSE
jgi:hypothetical protein